MGEFLDQPAKLSPSLRGRKGHAGITPEHSQILPPSSNHIYITDTVDDIQKMLPQTAECEINFPLACQKSAR
jgi:hypothetical protein